ncbi:MAG: hypothetical protein HY513_00895 [Candidatus Aenigmarchaeota archaeon]|nr:hypothetical protein [Candidatus Aenigmarchaeota archaeon]
MPIYEVNPWGRKTPQELAAHVARVTGSEPMTMYAKGWYSVYVMLVTQIPLPEGDEALAKKYLTENRKIKPDHLFTKDQLPLELS